MIHRCPDIFYYIVSAGKMQEPLSAAQKVTLISDCKIDMMRMQPFYRPLRGKIHGIRII